MWFIETKVFSHAIDALVGPDGFRELQTFLLRAPEAGEVIPGTRGLRKLRWSRAGGGKRGGIRVIYYWITEEKGIYLLYAFAKASVDNPTDLQVKALRRLVEEEFK